MADETAQQIGGRIGAHELWARTTDRTAATAKAREAARTPAARAKARAAMWQKFLDQAGGDPVKAEHLRQAYMARLQLKSLKARRKAKEVRLLIEAAEAEEELELLGGGG